MGRFKRGWNLSKQSWAVVKSDKSLLAFPIISVVAAIITMIIFFGGGAAIVVATDSPWGALPLVIIGAYLLTVVGVFASVALASCATEALEGRDTTVGQGIRAARGRMKLIFAWAAVALFVGVLISIIQGLLEEVVGGLASAIIGGIAGVVWAVATFFVIPVIALDGLGPKEAIKTSAHVVKERWGEGVVGSSAIGLITLFVAILPAFAIMFLGFVLLGSSAVGGGLLITIGVLVFVIALLFQTTIMAVFRVALYRYATEDQVLAGFDREALESAFVPKRKRRGARGGA
jgi:membrane-anchored glycerophosphoryl diester phosphodiesterase (GDPDase)